MTFSRGIGPFFGRLLELLSVRRTGLQWSFHTKHRETGEQTKDLFRL